MALCNLAAWRNGKGTTMAASCGSACGSGDKKTDKPAACGSGDKMADKPAACGSACGSGDK